MNELIYKIKKQEAIIGVVGLGYVGLPLAITFAKKYRVFGYDIDINIISTIKKGKSHIRDIKNKELQIYLEKSFFPTNELGKLQKCDFIIISVPTPLTRDKEPDLTHITDACEIIAKILRKKHFVILESTTYPGTTEEIVVPILEKSGLKAGIDFGVAYSPERVDPGSGYKIEEIPKIVAGIDKKCTEIAKKLYESVFDSVVTVSNCKTAEITKMFENIFRNVNIALVNEFALICEKMGINVWEVIDAAATKPFGFMPFYPGPGVGGHCIPLDPYYMSYRAKQFGIIPRFIELSGEINDFMRIHAVNLAEKGLKMLNVKIASSVISILGLAYKRDISDSRESPSKKIIEEVIKRGAKIKVYDPYVKEIYTDVGKFVSEKDVETAITDSDCAIFVTDHTAFRKLDLEEIAKKMRHPIIIDCKNIFKCSNLKDIVYFGIGKSTEVKL